ncbi:15714_t:CDS:1, partial [Funneliformis caledonium]
MLSKNNQQPREIIEIDVDSTKGITDIDNTNVDLKTEFMEILDPTNDNTKVTISKRILEIEKFNFEIKKANNVVYGVPRSFQEITDTFESFRKKQAAKSQEPIQEIMDPEIEMTKS